jgi:hypothetical protein
MSGLAPLVQRSGAPPPNEDGARTSSAAPQYDQDKHDDDNDHQNGPQHEKHLQLKPADFRQTGLAISSVAPASSTATCGESARSVTLRTRSRTWDRTAYLSDRRARPGVRVATTTVTPCPRAVMVSGHHEAATAGGGVTRSVAVSLCHSAMSRTSADLFTSPRSESV